MPPQPPHHPVITLFDDERAKHLELRLADRITAFVGSMPFVYIHVVVFALWMIVFEPSPWPTLTLAVSLEAIFLSCFVMIGQNHQAAFQQAKADHEYLQGERELRLNTDLTRAIHELTREVHERVLGDSATTGHRPPPELAGATAARPGAPSNEVPTAGADGSPARVPPPAPPGSSGPPMQG